MIEIPDGLIRGVPPPRRPWLGRLPGWIDACARDWALHLEPPYPGLWLNYVAPVTLPDGTPAVLKMGDPADREFASELAALRLYEGDGMVRLLRADPERGALLLDRLGAPLSEVRDDDAAVIAVAEVMRNLRRPAPKAPHPFPNVTDWARGLGRLRARYGGGTGPFPSGLVSAAETLFADLLGSSGPACVLHGDLHRGNVLAAERVPWMAIDPKGVVGEPAFETAAAVRADLPEGADPRGVYARRIAILSECLGLDPGRVGAWALAQAVLSAWWTAEDGGDPRKAIAWAEALRG